jgi:hypothetical protein
LALLVTGFFSRWLPFDGASAVVGDSSIFMYVGQQVNRGLLPYVQVFDDKGPVLLYLNALGLRIGGGSPLGMVWLGAISAFAFLVVIWTAVRRSLGPSPALFSVLVTVGLLPGTFLTPNSCELFSLPFQAASFLLLVNEFSGPRHLWFPLIQGFVAAVLAQIRPNNAGVILLYCILATYVCFRERDWRGFFSRTAIFAAAFVIGNLAVLSHLILSGHFPEYFDAVFGYSLRYSSSASLARHFYAVGVGLLQMSASAGSVIAGAAAAGTIVSLGRKRLRWAGGQADRFKISVVSLSMIEVACAAVSGKAFEHYFALWLLPVALLSGMFLKQCEDLIVDIRSEDRFIARAMFAGACALMIISALFENARSYGQTLLKYRDSRAGVVSFVRRQATPADTLFAWGDVGDISFRIGLRPASRHFSAFYPLNDAASFREIGTQALEDVVGSKPRFILDCPMTGLTPLLTQPSATQTSVPEQESILRPFRTNLMNAYHLVFTDATSGVNVYELNSPRSAPPQTGPA